MRDTWWFLLDINEESPFILPAVPLFSHSCSNHLFAQFNSFLDNSVHQYRFLDAPGRVAQEAFCQGSKLSDAIHFWFSGTSSSYLKRHIQSGQHSPRCNSFQLPQQIEHSFGLGLYISGFCTGSLSKGESFSSELIRKTSGFLMRLLSTKADTVQSLPLLSLASALIQPFKNLHPEVLDGCPKNEGTKGHTFLNRGHNDVEPRGSSVFSHPYLNREKHAVEPRTGIEFPMVLEYASTREKKSNLAPEILVGTGSGTMKRVRINFKVYAFGFYVHPNSLCEKLGWKYASNQVCELDKGHNFYQDLLREDIGMTVRLVINWKGIKINTVRDVFEKSLRARLLKTNPNTDYSCVQAFCSLFTKDIPLRVGTTVEIRRTADGCLITEIEGNRIGSIQSKELCRAFFDMYLGDVPVSKETKDDIGRNVASIMAKC